MENDKNEIVFLLDLNLDDPENFNWLNRLKDGSKGGVMKEDEQRKRFRDELIDLEEEEGITVGEVPVEKQKDEPPPSKEGDPETYNTNEAGPQVA
jgi:hypothetical protein